MVGPSEKTGAVLVADSGATRTRACVVTYDGTILGRGICGPGNPCAVGYATATANLADALELALRDCGLSPSAIAATVVGSAGVEQSGQGKAALRAAIRRVLPSGRMALCGDMNIALEGALGSGAGVVIVSGTGSVVFGRNARGATARVGGWGAVMGDEGSAQWIARQALAAAAHANDKSGPPTRLLPVLTRHFRARSLYAIVPAVYRDTTPRALGALAPLVVRTARHQDQVARSILQHAGNELARLAAAAIRQLHLGAPRVSYQGSVFCAGSLILIPMKRALSSLVPGAKLVAPVLPPLGGAWRLALQMLGLTPTSAAIARFAKAGRGTGVPPVITRPKRPCHI